MSFDALQEKIRAKKNPTVAGLDPKPEQIPPHILKASYETYGETLQGAAEAVWTFNQGLIDALCDVVPAVKPQAAYYERLGWRGLEVMERTIAYAREKDLFVIADIKRGDIGSTAQAYADAWLGETRVGEASHPVFNADCVTLNGYMGSDTIEPFVEACKAGDKCLFLLVKTSNPGSGELQNMVAGDRLVYKVMGDMTAKLGKGTEGRYGFHLAGAVVDALAEQRLAGKVCVVGQDGDLAACQRIVEGTQSMTVYKPVDKLASRAAQETVRLIKGETLECEYFLTEDGDQIPYIRLAPVAVTLDNMQSVIIDSGFHLREDVYLNRPDLMKP